MPIKEPQALEEVGTCRVDGLCYLLGHDCANDFDCRSDTMCSLTTKKCVEPSPTGCSRTKQCTGVNNPTGRGCIPGNTLSKCTAGSNAQAADKQVKGLQCNPSSGSPVLEACLNCNSNKCDTCINGFALAPQASGSLKVCIQMCGEGENAISCKCVKSGKPIDTTITGDYQVCTESTGLFCDISTGQCTTGCDMEHCEECPGGVCTYCDEGYGCIADGSPKESDCTSCSLLCDQAKNITKECICGGFDAEICTGEEFCVDGACGTIIPCTDQITGTCQCGADLCDVGVNDCVELKCLKRCSPLTEFEDVCSCNKQLCGDDIKLNKHRCYENQCTKVCKTGESECYCFNDDICSGSEACKNSVCIPFCDNTHENCYCRIDSECGDGYTCKENVCLLACPDNQPDPIPTGCICGEETCSGRNVCRLSGSTKMCVDLVDKICTDDYQCDGLNVSLEAGYAFYCRCPTEANGITSCGSSTNYCATYKKPTAGEYCYRSEDCATTKYCAKPGTSSCTACSYSQPAQFKTCNCGTSLQHMSNCMYCSTQTVCTRCREGYFSPADKGSCLQNCSDSIFSTTFCRCPISENQNTGDNCGAEAVCISDGKCAYKCENENCKACDNKGLCSQCENLFTCVGGYPCQTCQKQCTELTITDCVCGDSICSKHCLLGACMDLCEDEILNDVGIHQNNCICDGKTCLAGNKCENGKCLPPCGDVFCLESQTCVDSECRDLCPADVPVEQDCLCKKASGDEPAIVCPSTQICASNTCRPTCTPTTVDLTQCYCSTQQNNCPKGYGCFANECKLVCYDGFPVTAMFTGCKCGEYTCTTGKICVAGQCITQGTTTGCSTDYDCIDTEYCKSGKCTVFSQSVSQCFRSSQCSGESRVCGNPSSTTKGSCGNCSNFPDAVQMSGCKCGTAEGCFSCSGTKCASCIDSFHKVGDVCIRNCKLGEVNTKACWCAGANNQCAVGQTCEASGCKTPTGCTSPSLTECMSCAAEDKCDKCRPGNYCSFTAYKYEQSEVYLSQDVCHTEEKCLIKCSATVSQDCHCGQGAFFEVCAAGHVCVTNDSDQFVCQEALQCSDLIKPFCESCVGSADACRKCVADAYCAEDRTKTEKCQAECIPTCVLGKKDRCICGSEQALCDQAVGKCLVNSTNAKKCYSQCQDGVANDCYCGEADVPCYVSSGEVCSAGVCTPKCESEIQLPAKCACQGELCDKDSYCIDAGCKKLTACSAIAKPLCKYCLLPDQCQKCETGYAPNNGICSHSCIKSGTEIKCRHDQKCDKTSTLPKCLDKCAIVAQDAACYCTQDADCRNGSKCNILTETCENTCGTGQISTQCMCGNQMCGAKHYCVDNKFCYTNPTAKACNLDTDCADNYHCLCESKTSCYSDINKHCVANLATKCNRTLDCKANNQFCLITTISGTCEACGSQPSLDVQTCFCGDAKYCASCNEATLKCATCITGYTNIQAQCYKNCPDGTLKAECSCNGLICKQGQQCSNGKCACASGYACKENPSSTTDCVQGCVAKCTDQTLEQCICGGAYCDTKCLGGLCGEYCSFANCLLCSKGQCIKCQSSSYKLKDGQCNAKMSGGAIAGIVVGVVLGLALIAVLLWYFLYYQKRHKKQLPAVFGTKTVPMDAASSAVRMENIKRQSLTPLRNCSKDNIKPAVEISLDG